MSLCFSRPGESNHTDFGNVGKTLSFASVFEPAFTKMDQIIYQKCNKQLGIVSESDYRVPILNVEAVLNDFGVTLENVTDQKLHLNPLRFHTKHDTEKVACVSCC